jgi:tRNA(Ile2) C34 agmatinyltransferase TiaS
MPFDTVYYSDEDPSPSCPRCGGTLDGHDDGGVVCLSCSTRYHYEEDPRNR